MRAIEFTNEAVGRRGFLKGVGSSAVATSQANKLVILGKNIEKIAPTRSQRSALNQLSNINVKDIMSIMLKQQKPDLITL